MLTFFEYATRLSSWRLAAVLSCALAGCDFPGRPDRADRPVPANQVVDFDLLFRTNCVGCHGAEGKLGPAPPLNDAIFLSIVPDAELLRVIGEGRPGTPMSAFAKQRGGPLNEAQVKALAAGLKSRWKSPVGVKDPLPSYLAAEPDGSNASTDNLDLGAKSFARACAVCHGEHGRGTAMAGAINDSAFLTLISDRVLRRIIITGRPDLGMPNFADKKARGSDYQAISSAEIDALVALLAAWRHSTPQSSASAKGVPASQSSTDGEGRKP